jgi:hypothetical protein
LEIQDRVQLALDSIHGVDLNPFAVAIARFRLIVAALQACGLTSLEKAPNFRYHVAAGDSLLHGSAQSTLPIDGADYDAAMSAMTYSTEDLEQLKEILQPGRYDVVVGNPPYITVKDKKLNEAYRARYETCKGKYALTAPFMERFLQLATREGDGRRAGWVGQITSNSFMKREFGSKLIEEFFPKVSLSLVADTSGAYIPGHGTPTVIIVGRNARPTDTPVRAILGVRGEPGRPADVAQGLVWSSIVDHFNEPGYEDTWINVVDLDRSGLDTHPWSLSGGGALSLVSRLDAGGRGLRDQVASIGFAAITGDDAVYVAGEVTPRCWPTDKVPTRPFVEGDSVRDYRLVHAPSAAFPYEHGKPALRLEQTPSFWPYRTNLRSGLAFGRTREDQGRSWIEYILPNWPRLNARLLITFAFVATHNHFVLDRGGKVFKQSAPVIKLPEGASEDDHLGLLGVLNSSTACFWLRQNSHDKGRPGAEAAGADEAWEHRYEFTGTTLADFPLPPQTPLNLARRLDQLTVQLSEASPSARCDKRTPNEEDLNAARSAHQQIKRTMVALQEELDWVVYAQYGLVDAEVAPGLPSVPEIEPAERPFAIRLAQQMEDGLDTSWFKHWNHRFEPVTAVPNTWPVDYRRLVQKRLDLIESDPNIRLLEKPEYKRRWAAEPWEKQQESALRGWLLDRLEDRKFWFSQGRPTPRSISQLADEVARDGDLTSVLALWEGRRDVPIVQSLTRLIMDEAVPYLAAYRLKDSGLRKREAWEETWALQRREDAGEKVGRIPVPPKYTNADFRKPAWWQARGKLDVPKERFILYPDAGRTTDPTMLLGWAGWDHAQQALALATIVAEREAEGWDDERLIPLVAGMAELQPWVEQWHADIDPAYGISLAAFCREQLAERSRQVNQSIEELAAWRPMITRGRRVRA